MIMAEILGKIGEGTPSLDEKEDVLTSNVFQMIKYLKPSDGIIQILNSAFEENGINQELNSDVEWMVEYIFWPKGIKIGREPDLLILMEGGGQSYAIVVEAKYLSGPSDRVDIDVELEKEFGNQLSDQFIDLQQRSYKCRGDLIVLDVPLENRFLIYLTAHTTKPSHELHAAKEQYSTNHPESISKIEHQLVWLNWTGVWSTLKDVDIVGFPFVQIREDLISLLEKKGFKHFQGFTLEEWNFVYQQFFIEPWFKFKEKDISFKYERFYHEA